MFARVLIVVLFLASAAFASDRVPVIVSLQPAAEGQIAALQRSVLNEVDADGIVVTAAWKNIAGFAAEVPADAIDQLRRHPRVLSVEPDLPGGGGLVESSALIGANAVHSMGYTGSGVTVAILDSGIDLSHPDFAGRIADEQCFCRNSNGTGCCPNGQTSQSGPGAAADDHGHGTNVAGILASAGLVSHRGIAPGARLIVVKVLDRQNRFAGFSQVMSGIDWVLSNHPEVRAVNMSLFTDALFTTHCDSALPGFAQATEQLRARGGLIFACSGNSASSTSIGAPACVEKVMSIGAVHDVPRSSFTAFGCTDAPAVADQVTCFTNINATLDLLGPGVTVTASGRGGGLSTFTGTSQATPQAAAAAAILWQVNPALSPDAVEVLLETSGRKVPAAGQQVSFPRIDLPAAVQQAMPPPAARGPRRRAVRR